MAAERPKEIPKGTGNIIWSVYKSVIEELEGKKPEVTKSLGGVSDPIASDNLLEGLNGEKQGDLTP